MRYNTDALRGTDRLVRLLAQAFGESDELVARVLERFDGMGHNDMCSLFYKLK
jgi:hypothetical protein